MAKSERFMAEILAEALRNPSPPQARVLTGDIRKAAVIRDPVTGDRWGRNDARAIRLRRTMGNPK